MVTGDTRFRLDNLIWLSRTTFALENIKFASPRFEHKRTPQFGSYKIRTLEWIPVFWYWYT